MSHILFLHRLLPGASIHKQTKQGNQTPSLDSHAPNSRLRPRPLIKPIKGRTLQSCCRCRERFVKSPANQGLLWERVYNAGETETKWQVSRLLLQVQHSAYMQVLRIKQCDNSVVAKNCYIKSHDSHIQANQYIYVHFVLQVIADAVDQVIQHLWMPWKAPERSSSMCHASTLIQLPRRATTLQPLTATRNLKLMEK